MYLSFNLEFEKVYNGTPSFKDHETRNPTANRFQIKSSEMPLLIYISSRSCVLFLFVLIFLPSFVYCSSTRNMLIGDVLLFQGSQMHLDMCLVTKECVQFVLNKHECIHTCIHTYIHTYKHTYLHTYIHTYLHTYVRM